MSFVYDIRLNHVGFPCRAKKIFVYYGEPHETFKVTRISLGQITDYYTGKLQSSTEHDTVTGKTTLVGDFSSITKEGIYKIHIGDKHSRTFYIYDKVYDPVCRTLTQYFEWQRCGDDSGYNPNCHLGDKITDKNGDVHILAGGHHQSGDLRKWTFGCPHGTYSLSEYLIKNRPLWNRGRLEYEIKHSAKHYLSRISPDGYVFDSTFVPEYYDNAKYHGVGFPSETAFWDNFMYFDEPTDPHGHCNVIRLLASASISLRHKDPTYADKCIAGAIKIADWMHNIGQFRESHQWKIYPPLGHDTFKELYFDFYYENSAHMLADIALAEIDIYKATGDKQYKSRSLERLKKLAVLQIKNADGSHAKFRTSKQSERYAEEIKFFPVNFPLVYAKALDTFGDCNDSAFLLDMICSFVKAFKKQTQSNAFGKTTTKIQIIDGIETPDYHASSYVQDIADTAIFLTIASRYTEKEECLGIAQRLLDFIVGGNHADSSCIEAVGFNQLPYAVFGEFFPPIPKIPGAVITEIYYTDPQDDIYGREYDMPMVGSTLLAFAEYQNEISK